MQLHRAVLAPALFLAATVATGALADQAHPYQPGPALTEEANSQDLCESVPDRIFVATKIGSECVAYTASKGYEDRREAVFLINGDSQGFADAADYEASAQKRTQSVRRSLQKFSEQMHVRFIDVARLGLWGSSGNHRRRMEKRETMILGAAISLLKQRLGIDTIALAGQSRGSIIGASLLSLHLRGVKCAALASGALELVNFEVAGQSKSRHPLTRAQISRIAYDPYAHIDSIERDPDRRVFIVGDPQDKISNFQQELEYTEAVKAAGHHALAIPVKAKDDMHHDSVRFALRAAAACLNDAPDDLIVQAVAAMQTERKPVSAARTAVTFDTAIGEIAQLSQPTVINDEGAQ
jgi:pimeloyl-ACP methyl ester carboxylesterase